MVAHEGSGVGQVEVLGSTIQIDGTVVATTTGGVGASDPLVITFNANADSGAVEAISQRVAYQNVSDNPNELPRTISMQVTDGDGGVSGLENRSLNVVAVNDAPVNTTPVNATVVEETATAISGLSISDVDSTTMDVTTRLQVTGGVVNVTLSGSATVFAGGNGTGDLTLIGSVADINATLASLTYTGNTNVTGVSADTLTITTDDLGNYGTGGALQDVDTIQIDITNVNDAPVLDSSGDATLTSIHEDDIANNGDLVSDILATGAGGDPISDVDGDPEGIAIRALTLPGNGTWQYSLDGGGSWTDVGTVDDTNALLLRGTDRVRYVPDQIAGETAEFSFRAWDQTAGTAGAKVDTSVSGLTTPYSIATETATIMVTDVNDAPVGANDAYTLAEGATLNIPAAGPLGNDVDVDGDALNAVLVSGPANGALTLNADGSFSYTHDSSETTTDSFTYRVEDGNGGFDTATVNLTITPVNDAPVGVTDSYTVAEGSTLNISVSGVLSNDTDAEGDALTSVLVSGPAHGTVTLNPDGTFTYTHDGTETTADSFTYQVDDGNGGAATGLVNLNVVPFNDAPTAGADNFVVDEGAVLTVAAPGVLGNDTDAEGNPLSATVAAGPSYGTLSLNSDGSFVYTHDGSETTTDFFTYIVDDGNGGTTTGTVNLSINPVNDAPVASDDTYTVDEGATLNVAIPGVMGNDVDVDGDPLSATVLTGPAHGVLSLNVDGSFSYVHDGSETLVDSFVYTIDDGNGETATANVTINIQPVNDAPTIAGPTMQTASEDTPLVFSAGGGNSITFADVDAAAGPVLLQIDVTNGTLTLGSTAGLTFAAGDGTQDTTMTIVGTLAELNAALEGAEFQPDGDFQGTAQIALTIDDQGNLGSGGALTDTQMIAIQVNPVNDAPVATIDSFTVDEGATLNVDAVSGLLANDADVDDTILSVNLMSGPRHGSIVVNSDGSFTYVHDGSETTADSFSYQVMDASGATDTATVSLSINPVNDAPEAEDDRFFVPVLQGLSVGGAGVTANDSDVDDPMGRTTMLTPPSSGTASMNADGTFTYVPEPGFIGTDSFTYWLEDSSGAGSVATVTIEVVALQQTTGTDNGGGTGSEQADLNPTTETGGGQQVQTSTFTIGTALIDGVNTNVAELGNEARGERVERGEVELGQPTLDRVESAGTERQAFASELVGDRRDVNFVPLQVLATESSSVERMDYAEHSRIPIHLTEFEEFVEQTESLGWWGGMTMSATASAVTAGYLIWSIRSGFLAASMLTSLPAWMQVDPLPVLDFVNRRRQSRQKAADGLLPMAKQEQLPTFLATQIRQ